MITVVAERADELKGLCFTYNVRRLDLSGSASTDLYDSDGSDLDFLAGGSHPSAEQGQQVLPGRR